jgi:cytochrome c oxidase cbb3-type subunit 3
MLREVLHSIQGIAIYPVIGIFIFVAAFLAVIVYTWRMRKSEVDYASRLPLDESAVDAISERRVPTEDRPGGNS